jgi:hypothetical protein
MRQFRLETSANEIHTFWGRLETVRRAVPLLSFRAARPAKPYENPSTSGEAEVIPLTPLVSARLDLQPRFFDPDSSFLARCGSSRFQNGSRSREDVGRGVVGDSLFDFQSVLNVAKAEVRAFEAKCFAANRGDRLRFDLADVPCVLFTIH